MATSSQEAITSYVTDMLALERHLEKALAGQIADLDEAPDIVQHLRKIHDTCEQHIAALQSLADRRETGGQGIAETVKKAASSLLGMGAAAVDFVRGEKLPKDLRDDYAAVSLACIGYVMLHTTGLALNDAEVADLAHRYLQDHAKSTMTLHNIVPIAVVRFLAEEGHPLREDVLPEVEQNIQSVWKSENGVPHTDQGAYSGNAGSR